jgi:signal transduction histidine kinase
MVQDAHDTEFPHTDRADPDEIMRQHRKLAADPVITKLLDSFPEAALILNRQRRIVLANERVVTLLAQSLESLLGRHVGAVFGCAHALDDAAGCGATRFCQHCGAVRAVLNSQRSEVLDVQECRILTSRSGRMTALDVRVRATPLAVGDEMFTVFAIRDTSDEKRRDVLERLFFHDVLNTVSGLRGMLEIWPGLSGDEALDAYQTANRLAEQLAEEIESQRDLAAAERGDLKARRDEFDAAGLLEQLCSVFRHHPVAMGKRIELQPLLSRLMLQTDERLLGRVLANLIKNALEASDPGQTITVSFENHGPPTFRVHNPAVMPEDVQTQMFQRSFSTKAGSGRGIGTYSVKLLTEQYLNGTVEFRSMPGEGTIFVVRLPETESRTE